MEWNNGEREPSMQREKQKRQARNENRKRMESVIGSRQTERGRNMENGGKTPNKYSLVMEEREEKRFGILRTMKRNPREKERVGKE